MAINRLERRVHKSEYLLNQMNLRLGEYLEMIATKIESHAILTTREIITAVNSTRKGK